MDKHPTENQTLRKGLYPVSINEKMSYMLSRALLDTKKRKEGGTAPGSFPGPTTRATAVLPSASRKSHLDSKTGA